MNPWVIGILGLLIGALPSAYFYMQLSPLQRKLQLAEKGKERSEQAYNEAQAELESKNDEIEAAKAKIPELEAHYRSEIDHLEQSHQSQIEELKQAQAQIPELEAQIEDMKASQVRVIELESQIAELQASQSLAPDPQIALEQQHALQQEHQTEIQQLQEDSQGQIQAIQEQHRAELEELLGTHQTQLEEVEERYQSELRSLESTYQQQILEVQQDFEERLAESEAFSNKARQDEQLDHHPPSIEPVVAFVDHEPSLDQVEDNLGVVEDLVTPDIEGESFEEMSDTGDDTESQSLLAEKASDLDQVFAVTAENSLDDVLEMETVEQASSPEEDIAGLDAFLEETEESPIAETSGAEEAIAGLNALLEETEDTEAQDIAEIPSIEGEKEVSVEDDIAGLDAFLEETEESPIAETSGAEEAIAGLNALLEETEDTEAQDVAEIPSIEGQQAGSIDEDIADLDQFLSDTANVAVDDSEEDALLEPFSEEANSPDELEFLASLQKDDSPLHPEMMEGGEVESLPDLADLSTPDDDFFNMLQEDAVDDGLPSEPSLSDQDNPFANIVGEEAANNGDAPQNGHKKQLEELDELFNLVDHEVPSDR